MKIKEYIKKLKEFDQEQEVYVETDDDGFVPYPFEDRRTLILFYDEMWQSEFMLKHHYDEDIDVTKLKGKVVFTV